MRPTNGSWCVDETYLRVAGKWTYLHRAVDSKGAIIDFLPSARRDANAAKRFFQKALRSPGHPRPRVINVDGSQAYPKAISEAQARRRTGPTLSMAACALSEQHRRAGSPSIKRRVRASQGFRSFHAAARTIAGIETVNKIRKGQVRRLAQGDIAGQVAFVNRLFDLTSAA